MDDPYKTPQASLAVEHDGEVELAPLSARFWGSMVDGLFGLGSAFVLYWSMDIWDQIVAGTVPTMVLVQIGILGLLFFCLIHGYTLATRGQTLGKVLAKTQIVSMEDDSLLPLWKILLLRYAPITVVTMVPIVGNFATLIDIVYILRDDRRCIHDHIAGTKVIRYVG